MRGDGRLQAVWRQNRGWPILLCLLLLASFGLFFVNQEFVGPSVAQLERDYIALQERNRQVRKLRASAETPRTFYQRGIQDLETFRSLIPRQADFTELVAEIFRLAATSGLRIARVTYEPEAVAEYGLLRYGLVFSVTGNYTQLKEFIALLEASDRLIAIEGIALRSEGKGGGAANLQLELTTYFQAGAA